MRLAETTVPTGKVCERLPQVPKDATHLGANFSIAARVREPAASGPTPQRTTAMRAPWSVPQTVRLSIRLGFSKVATTG